MTGFKAANVSKNTTPLARFSGNWVLKMPGEVGGICDIAIDEAGQVTGTCSQQSATSDLAGVVTAAGEFSATIGSGVDFSGNFTSPVNTGGTWSHSGAYGGWTASHQ